jgi:hypothetical protein
MNKRIGLLRKLLVIGINILFISIAVQPSIATELDIEPKDYLFQTIMDIASNPEVKELFEQYDYDLFSMDIDRIVYRKLFLSNPRLTFNTLFTKPSMSVEYLDKCYNNGIEITDVLGEDKVLEVIENVEVTDSKWLDELYNIISKDEELSSRLETLKEMNNEINPILGFPIICSILEFLILPYFILYELIEVFIDFYFISLFLAFIVAIGFPYWTAVIILAYGFDCF